mmetsp:Transcript_5492/g.12655  ORF Transcript_5492/g.12655 Transcript_5492/m.12655 type:complete len:270 (-) Transcript_5492:203-1012(-)
MREADLEVGQRRDARPHRFIGRAHRAEDLEEFVNLGVSGEERLPRCDLGEDAAGRPHVHRRVVLLLAKKQLGRAVPERHHLVRVALLGLELTRSGEAEVGDLDGAEAVDQHVLRLEVAVKDPLAVAELEASQDLQHAPLDETLRHAVLEIALEALLQILVEVVEDEQHLWGDQDEVAHAHDVDVVQLLQERHLAQRRHRHALVAVLQADLLERHQLPLGVFRVVRPVDDAIRALADQCDLVEALGDVAAYALSLSSRRLGTSAPPTSVE